MLLQQAAQQCSSEVQVAQAAAQAARYKAAALRAAVDKLGAAGSGGRFEALLAPARALAGVQLQSKEAARLLFCRCPANDHLRSKFPALFLGS